MSRTITATINGRSVSAAAAARTTLLEFLRETLRLAGAKEGCGNGNCGTCTVLVDGQPVNACLVLAAEVEGSTILTVEGLAGDATLHPLQDAFLEVGATQCGFCTPGMLLTAKALLDANPAPSEDEIRHAIAGNLCRCTGYGKIVEAISRAATTMRAR